MEGEYVWNIDKARMQVLFAGDQYGKATDGIATSPIFVVGGHSFQLEMGACAAETSAKGPDPLFVSCFIRKLPPYTETVHARLLITLKKHAIVGQEETFLLNGALRTFDKETPRWGYRNLSDCRPTLEALQKAHFIGADGSLCFTARLTIARMEISPAAMELCEDWKAALLDPMLADFKLALPCGTEIPVNGAVLAARSAVWRALFTHKTEESITKTIQLDANPAVANALLAFVYSASSEPALALTKLDDYLALFELAESYELSTLCQLLLNPITANLTSAQVPRFLAVASRMAARPVRPRESTFLGTPGKQLMDGVKQYVRTNMDDFLTKLPSMLT